MTDPEQPSKPEPTKSDGANPAAQPAAAEPSAAPEDKPGEGDVKNLNATQMKRFVTSIKDPIHQVGEHVVGALQHDDTVAVLTTVVVGPGGQQHIVSAAIDEAKMAEINALLQSAVETREPEAPCVGFHCLLKPKSN